MKKAVKLSFLESSFPLATEIYKKSYDVYIKEIEEFNKKIMSETLTFNKQIRDIQEAADGKKLDIYYDFVKDICSKVVVSK